MLRSQYILPALGSIPGSDAGISTRPASYSIGAAPVVSTTSLPAGTKDQAYSQALAATGGFGTLVWDKSVGTLPTGITVTTAGVVQGTPTVVETTAFTVRATDTLGRSGSKDLTLAIGAAGTLADLDSYYMFDDANVAKTGADIDTLLDAGAGLNDAPNVGFGKLVQGTTIDGFKTLLGAGGAEWYRTSGNGSTMVDSTGGVFYFAAHLTSNAGLGSFFLDTPIIGNGVIKVLDVGGTSTLRVSFGTGGAGNVTVDVPFPLNQLNFVYIRFVKVGGDVTLAASVNFGAEVTHTAAGDQLASLVANKVHLFGGTWSAPQGRTLFFASKKGNPSNGELSSKRAAWKAKYASLPI